MKTLEVNYNMKFIWRICVVAAMGGFLFGYDWVVVGGAKPFYEPFFLIGDNTPFMRGFAMSSALFGCIAGAILSGMLADRLGRKRLLISSGLLFTVSAVGTALCWDFFSYNLARIIGGIGIGLASNLSPMYIAEVSPAAMRGKFVSINQLTIVIGILAAQLVNMMIARPVLTADQVRLLASEGSAAAVVVRDAGFDIEKEKEAAKLIVDEVGLRNVKEKFPDIAYIIAATEDEIEAKKAEDNQIMSAYISPTWNGLKGWRWMFGAETVAAFLFFLLMFFVPESPRWLVKYDRGGDAERILARVGGAAYGKAEVADIQHTLASEDVARVRFKDLLEPKLRKVITLGVFLAVLQQWCGINVIFNYAQEVFQAAGYGVSDILFNIVITGIVNLAATFVAIRTVDHLGRKALMLIGTGGLVCFYALLGTGYYFHSTGIHMLLLIVISIACYAMTLAPVTWVLISELFPNRIRGAAMSIAVLSLWIACAALTLSFPYVKGLLGAHGAFWVFGGICVVGCIVIFKKLPETKGKTLEDIERELVD
ncbi:MAG: MFS transporter [Sedimentisphaerales bacterium]|nr:MFS transporter [Sedimentisphaerales bacterium]